MMERIHILASRFADLFRSRKLDRELRDELEFHLDMETAENLRRGMSAEEARRQARITLGGVDRIREQCRYRRGFPFISDTIQDIRYGARILLRNPVFAFAAIATLTLGIGANTAVFSVVSAAMPHPLPFDKPDELIKIATNTKSFMSFTTHIGIDFQTLRGDSMNTVDIARYHTPAPHPVIKKGYASPSSVSYVMTAKFVDGVPLYRQEKHFECLGLEISRNVLSERKTVKASSKTPGYAGVPGKKRGFRRLPQIQRIRL